MLAAYEDKEVTDEESELLKTEVGQTRLRRAGRILDVSKSGYYNADLCLEDFSKAVEILDSQFKGKYKAAFLIDNSPIHRCSAIISSDRSSYIDSGLLYVRQATF